MVWGVENRRVLQVARDDDDGSYRVSLRAGETSYAVGARLTAEEVLGVASGVAVYPAVTVLRRFWGEPVAGLAIHDGIPVVVVDPDEPPAALGG
jgi:hypothetical protein